MHGAPLGSDLPPPPPPPPFGPPADSAAAPLPPAPSPGRDWAVTTGFAGGVLILAGSFLLAVVLTFLSLAGAWPEGWAWGGDGFSGAAAFIAFAGLLSGALVLYSAARLRTAEDDALVPGLGLVTGGVLSFFALGGFVVGGLLAIVGGVLAVAGAPPMLMQRAPRWRAADRA